MRYVGSAEMSRITFGIFEVSYDSYFMVDLRFE